MLTQDMYDKVSRLYELELSRGDRLIKRTKAAEARVAQLLEENRELTEANNALRAERDGMRCEFQSLVDDIVNFPGIFNSGTESVEHAIKFLEAH